MIVGMERRATLPEAARMREAPKRAGEGLLPRRMKGKKSLKKSRARKFFLRMVEPAEAAISMRIRWRTGRGVCITPPGFGA